MQQTRGRGHVPHSRNSFFYNLLVPSVLHLFHFVTYPTIVGYREVCLVIVRKNSFFEFSLKITILKLVRKVKWVSIKKLSAFPFSTIALKLCNLFWPNIAPKMCFRVNTNRNDFRNQTPFQQKNLIVWEVEICVQNWLPRFWCGLFDTDRPTDLERLIWFTTQSSD